VNSNPSTTIKMQSRFLSQVSKESLCQREVDEISAKGAVMHAA